MSGRCHAKESPPTHRSLPNMHAWEDKRKKKHAAFEMNSQDRAKANYCNTVLVPVSACAQEASHELTQTTKFKSCTTLHYLALPCTTLYYLVLVVHTIECVHGSIQQIMSTEIRQVLWAAWGNLQFWGSTHQRDKWCCVDSENEAEVQELISACLQLSSVQHDLGPERFYNSS